MSKDTRTAQDLFDEQFRLTSELSATTGEYHRLLQRLGAATVHLQMIEDDSKLESAVALQEAQSDVTAARIASEAYEEKIAALEKRLDAVIRELLERH